MSQIKVWKIIKKRREARIAAQKDAQIKKDEAEGELGRQLEEGNGRDKTLWEKAFGGNEKARHVDSGIGMDESGHSRKESGTITNTSEGDTIEMNNIKAPSIMSGKSAGKVGFCPQVTVRVAEEDEVSGLGFGDYADWRSRPSTDRDGVSHQVGAFKASSVIAESVKPTSISTRSVRSASSPKQQASGSDALPQSELLDSQKSVAGPSIPALPFKIDDHIEDGDDVGSERSSIATFAASDRLPSRLSKRLSGNRLLNRLSQGSRKSLVASTSEEALAIPHNDDQESSAAADVGELDETSSLASKPLSKSRSHEQNPLLQPLGSSDTDPKILTLADLPGLSRPEGLSSQAKPAKQASAGGDEVAKVEPEQQEEYSAPSTLQPHLPDNAPKIVTTYRTNEWAKHLDQAEAPIAQAATSESSNPHDQTAPVLVKELRQTPLTAEPKPATMTKTKSQEKLREKASKPRLSARLSSYITAPSRAASQTSLRDLRDPAEQANNSTNPSAQHSSRAFRSSSQPLLTSSPATINEDEETYFPPRASPLPSSMGVGLSSNDTLISQRHSKVSNRASATNFAQQQPQEYNPRRQSSTTAFPPMNIRRSTSSTLSTTTPSPYNNNNPISPPSSSTRLSHHLHQQLPHNPTPSSHHPTPQSSLISDWRTSLAAESSNPQKQQLDEMEFRRQELLREKNRKNRVSSSSSREQNTAMGGNRRVSSGGSGAGGGNGNGMGMRRMSAKDLGERHREAMRRMQGSVRI